MTSQLLCNLETFQLVTNLLYERGGIISIKYPPIGEIARFLHKRDNVKVELIPQHQYDEARDSVCSKEPACKHEIPRYDQIIEAFYSAGIPPLSGVKDLLSQNIEGRDVLKGHKPLWIGYDTCVLRRRFYSNIYEILSRRNGNASIGHAIAEGVNEELLVAMNNKNSQRDVSNLERIFPEARIFLNKATLDARLHRIGLAEIDLMKAHEVVRRLPSEKGDLEIIKGYKELEKSQNAELILFSSDNNFIETAADMSLKSHYVTYHPHRVEEYLKENELSLDLLNNLLYHLALVCGYIRLPGITVASIWPNKTVNDWKAGSVQVGVSGSLEEDFVRTHGILSKMKDKKLC